MRKSILCLLMLIVSISIIYGDYFVNFEGTNETKTAYASGNVTLSGLSWNMTEALIGNLANDWKNGTRSARLRGYGTSAMTMLENKTNGLGTLSFYYRRYSTEAQVDWKVEYSIDNGSSWTQIGSTFTAPASDTPSLFSEQVNVSGNVRIRIKRATESGTTDRRLNIDDITLTDYTAAEPTLILDPTVLIGFTYDLGEGPSASQSYTLSGAYLSPSSGNITITGSSSFEVSADNVTFSNSFSLPYSGGILSPATLYVRLKAGLSEGNYLNENITHSGGGASVFLAVSGSVTSTSVLLTAEGYLEDFTSFISLESLPSGWTLSDQYTYGGDFGTGSTGGLRGNGVLGIQLTASAPNNALTATLTLKNQTGATINNLNVAYQGKVARTDQPGTPKWVVSVNGTEIPELEYSTAEGINQQKSAVVTGLNIAVGENIIIQWFTTSAGTSGARRQIGIDDVNINTNIPVNPLINVTANLVTFQTAQGTPSEPQSYFLSGIDLSQNINISAPNGFEISLDGGLTYATYTSVLPTYEGNVFVRMTGTAVGTFGGNIIHTSLGATDVYLPVAGIVTGATGYAVDLFFSEYIEGSSSNKSIEIFNGTGSEVNLSDYKVALYSNGSTTPSSSLILSGTLENDDVYVISHPSANTNILAVTDLTNTVVNFNGNDALALIKISTGAYVDIFGVIGNDPGTAWLGENNYTTINSTLVRKSSVAQGVTQNPTGTGAYAFTTLVTEWDLYPVDTIDNLGFHNFAATPQEIEPPTVQVSNLIAYPGNTDITLEWTPGNGARRLIKINTINSFTPPVDGSNPTANNVYSGNGEQVIFNGATQIVEGIPLNGCNVSGLTPATTYWFRSYEYNGSGSNTRYNTSEAINNPISATTTNTQSSGYYAGITGYGNTLKTNLHNLIRTTHTTRYSYDALWIKLPYTDEDPNNTDNIIEIYTGWSVPKSYYGGGTSQWNREHTWSKSHGDFGETPPAGTDLHHLRPCDSTVNSAKSNKDFDYAPNPYIDSSPYNGYSSDTGCKTSTYAWEPRDEDKGDVARMIMYMAIRYEGTDTSFDLEIVDNINTSGPNYGKLSTLLQWHIIDPPDAREMQRNNRIQELQGNRNPFIDEPMYAYQIWAPMPLNPTNITQTGFTANWTAPISATKYYFQLATDANFTNIVPGYDNLDVGLTLSRNISGLSNRYTYYYRLRSYFTSGYSMYSPYQEVTLTLPASAQLSSGTALTEGNLNGAILQLTLTNTTWRDNTLLISSFTLNNAPAGLSLLSVQYLSATAAQIVLSFDNTDFDANILNFSVTINALEINNGSNLTTNTLTIIAYIECPLSIQIQGSQLILNIQEVSGANLYKVFSSTDPYGVYTEISTSGIFDPLVPNRWSYTIPADERRFYRSAAVRNP